MTTEQKPVPPDVERKRQNEETTEPARTIDTEPDEATVEEREHTDGGERSCEQADREAE
jgi:hypothetical protein